MSDTPITSAPQPSPDTAKPIPRAAGLAANAEQATKLASWLKAAGVPAEKIAEAARLDGYDVTPAPADDRSVVERQVGALSRGPDTPAEYHFAHGTVPTDVEGALRGGFHAMSLPASVGNAVGEWAAEDAAHYNSLTPEQKQAWDFQQLQQFQKIFPSVDEARADVSNLISTWRNAPGQRETVDRLLQSGWLRSSRVQTVLAQHCRNLGHYANLLTRGKK